jgi:hypothetical protein
MTATSIRNATPASGKRQKWETLVEWRSGLTDPLSIGRVDDPRLRSALRTKGPGMSGTVRNMAGIRLTMGSHALVIAL